MVEYGLDREFISVFESLMSNKDMWVEVDLPASHIALWLLTSTVVHVGFRAESRQATDLETMDLSS
jgi:hypothetical protein